MFVFDQDILAPAQRRPAGEFIRESLLSLDRQLHASGAGAGSAACASWLVVRYGQAVDGNLPAGPPAGSATVFANHDDEPATGPRCLGVLGKLAHHGVMFHTYKDHVIF